MNYEQLLSKATAVCSKSEKCKDDIKKYLQKCKAEQTDIEIIISYLEKNKYINEERFCKAFVNDKFKFNKWGKLKIKNELKQKNINGNLIEGCLAMINDKEYFDLLIQLLNSKNKTVKDTDTYKRKAKLFRFAVSRGFSTEDIYKALEVIL